MQGQPRLLPIHQKEPGGAGIEGRGTEVEAEGTGRKAAGSEIKGPEGRAGGEQEPR
jgi:hypothetical protein